jgi:hypothetical protein
LKEKFSKKQISCQETETNEKLKKISLILTQFPFESEIGERDIFVVLVFGFVKTKKKQSVTVAKCKNSFLLHKY